MAKYDITEIKNQSLGTIVADFYICQHCHIVDRDSDRGVVGHPCLNCGEASHSGRIYFSMSVHSLIDLMQEFFHKDQIEQPQTRDGLPNEVLSGKKNAKIAVVLFFVTLREVLLKNLLDDLMIAQQLPDSIRDRLFADSPMYKRRMDNLFPTLAGLKWKEAVRTLDYVELDEFLEKAVEARNKFLHRGSKYALTENMAEECIRHIWPLLNFHVSLHNNYVVPFYKK